MIQFFGQKHPICTEYARFPVPLRAITPISAEQAKDAYRALSDPENINTYGKRETPYPGADCFYYPPFLNDVYKAVGDHIRQFLDFDIVETYYYARRYDTGNELKIHADRGSCFVSVSLCLGYDYSPLFPEGSAWPIGALEGTETGPGKPIEFQMQPATACSIRAARPRTGATCFWAPNAARPSFTGCQKTTRSSANTMETPTNWPRPRLFLWISHDRPASYMCYFNHICVLFLSYLRCSPWHPWFSGITNANRHRSPDRQP